VRYRIIRASGVNSAWGIQASDGPGWLLEVDQRGQEELVELRRVEGGLVTQVRWRRCWGGRWCQISRGGEAAGRIIRWRWQSRARVRLAGEVPGPDRLEIERGEGTGKYRLVRCGREIGTIAIGGGGAVVEVRPQEDQALVLAMAIGLCCTDSAGRARGCRLAPLKGASQAMEGAGARN
jgi:hypothetical protein